MKGYPASYPILVLVLFCLIYPVKSAPSAELISNNDQSIEFGISYLNLQKSFLDFPIVWKTTMPLVSFNYELNIGKFLLGFGFSYGKSTYISINDEKRWGRNNFSIWGFKYDFLWSNSGHGKKRGFLWGLGATLENVEIDQKIEISPGKFNKYEDRYLGIGPKLDLSWSRSRSNIGLSLASTVTLPCASTGTLLSDDAFSDKTYLSWVKITTCLYFQYRISGNYQICFQLDREALAYGRSHKMTYDRERVYPYGSFLMRSLLVSLKYHF